MENGVLKILLPEVEAGEAFDVTVVLASKKAGEPIIRKAGLFEGLITISPDFDDPIPGFEEYQ